MWRSWNGTQLAGSVLARGRFRPFLLVTVMNRLGVFSAVAEGSGFLKTVVEVFDDTDGADRSSLQSLRSNSLLRNRWRCSDSLSVLKVLETFVRLSIFLQIGSPAREGEGPFRNDGVGTQFLPMRRGCGAIVIDLVARLVHTLGAGGALVTAETVDHEEPKVFLNHVDALAVKFPLIQTRTVKVLLLPIKRSESIAAHVLAAANSDKESILVKRTYSRNRVYGPDDEQVIPTAFI